MSPCLAVPLLFAVFAFAAPAPQEPAAPTSLSLPALVDRCFGGGDASRAALAELGRRIEADYPSVFAAWEAEQDARRRECLEHALRLPQVRGAATVVAGRITKVESTQGGVVDYHIVLARIDHPDVVRAASPHDEELGAGYFDVLRGSSWDWWLADRLQRCLEQDAAVGARVWLLKSSDLVRERAGEPARHLQIFEWQSLPAAAAACLRRLPPK